MIDNRLANRLRQKNPELYEKMRELAGKSNISVGEVVELACLNQLTYEPESRREFLLSLEQDIKGARVRAREKAREKMKGSPLESLPVDDKFWDVYEEAWPDEFDF